MNSPARIIERAIQALNLRTAFPPDCLAEAQALVDASNSGTNATSQPDATQPDATLPDAALLDLRHLPFVTIDNEGSRDLDQALLVEAHTIGKGPAGFRVRYALADASYYVPEHSALFAEAQRRGATYYLPTHSIPMLPRTLSEGLISLNPGVDRRALVFDLFLDHSGTTSRCDVLRGWIHSHAKLTYAGVQRWLDRDEPTHLAEHDHRPDATHLAELEHRTDAAHLGNHEQRSEHETWAESLRQLKRVGELLIEQQLARGAIEFQRLEARIAVAGSPPHFSVSLRDRLDTERYNEQISLLCNMQGARLLQGLSDHDPGLDAIYRAHDAPGERSLKALRRTLDALVVERGLGEQWRWQRDETLASYVARLPDDADNRRLVQAVQRQILLLQRASEFRAEAAPHHALKASSYARFSSPMREIVGIHTHAELLQAMGQGDAGHATSIDSGQARRDAVIAAANQARQTQKQLDKQIGLAVLKAHFAIDGDGAIDQDSAIDDNRSIVVGGDDVDAAEQGVTQRAGAQTQTHPGTDTHRHLGTITSLRDNKLYISLDSLALDVKVYADDLQAQFNCTYELTDVAAVPAVAGAPRWTFGQAIELLPAGFDSTQNRIRFSLMAA